MPFNEIGNFEGAYNKADLIDAQNIRGNVISAQQLILAGGTRGQLRTQDYVSGSAGWLIDASGYAEFYNAVLRGTITATGGTISGTLTVTGTIRTATSGERLEITADAAMSIYDSGGTLVGYIGYAPTGYGADDLVLATVAGLDNVVIDSDALVTLKAGGSAGTGVLIQSSPAGGSPGRPFWVTNSAGSADYLSVYDNSVRIQDGSVTTPGLCFTGDTNTGIYRAGADDGRLVAGGSSIAQFTSGRFGPGSDNTISLGSSGLRWTEVFAVAGTINTSDIREKDVLEDSDVPGLAFIRRLRPIKYTWKRSPREEKHVHWGLSAQDVLRLVGNEGPLRADDPDRLGLAYAELIPALIVAIQELSAIVENHVCQSSD